MAEATRVCQNPRCEELIPEAAKRSRRFCSKACYERDYRSRNRARRRSANKKYRDANKEAISARLRATENYAQRYANKIERHGREAVAEEMRRRQLWLRFGMTADDYEKLLEAQGGVCAICGRPPEQNGRRLAIDHDHLCCPDRRKSCGKCIRGLLCSACNNHLGILEMSHWTSAAYEYLAKNRRAA